MKRVGTLTCVGTVAVLILRCASAPSAPVASHPAEKSAKSRSESQFHNLKVIRPDISRDDLIATMKGFTHALGVRCNYCHEGEEGALDFAADGKDEKRTARVMIEMTRAINQQYIARVEGHGNVVECATCHRGKPVPEEHPAAERAE